MKRTLKAWGIALISTGEAPGLDGSIPYEAIVYQHTSKDMALGGGSVERPAGTDIDCASSELLIQGAAKELSEELGLNRNMVVETLRDTRRTVVLPRYRHHYRGAEHNVTVFVTDVTDVVMRMQRTSGRATRSKMAQCKNGFLKEVNTQLSSPSGCTQPIENDLHGRLDRREVSEVCVVPLQQLWTLSQNYFEDLKPAMWEVNARFIDSMRSEIESGIRHILSQKVNDNAVECTKPCLP
jgi:hypothetical protein